MQREKRTRKRKHTGRPRENTTKTSREKLAVDLRGKKRNLQFVTCA